MSDDILLVVLGLLGILLFVGVLCYVLGMGVEIILGRSLTLMQKLIVGFLVYYVGSGFVTKSSE